MCPKMQTKASCASSYSRVRKAATVEETILSLLTLLFLRIRRRALCIG